MAHRTIRDLLLVAMILTLGALQVSWAWQLTDAQKSFVDRWIEKKGLNPYGDPKGTAYMGGTPLFDESTGQVVDRYDYILARHPELVKELGLKLSAPEYSELLRQLETDLEMARKDLGLELKQPAPDKDRVTHLRNRIARLEGEIDAIQKQMARFEVLYRNV